MPLGSLLVRRLPFQNRSCREAALVRAFGVGGEFEVRRNQRLLEGGEDTDNTG
jgi:hypothetical protein